MYCPACGATLAPVHKHGVSYRACPKCLGIWIEPEQIAQLAAVVPSPMVAARPAPKRLEERAPGEGAGRGVPFGGAHSKVKPEAPKSLIEDIFSPGSD